MPRFIPSSRRENKTLEETRRVRNASPELVGFARDHRKAPTTAEEVLWSALRNQQLNGLKFRLVIELDGGYHDTADQQLRDKERSKLQELRGYRIIRFGNQEVLENLPAVIKGIQKVIDTE